MRKVQTTDANTPVRIHNDLASGKGDFSACMLDVLFYILSDLKKGERFYTITAQDIMTITGREWNYQQFKEATEAIGSRMFEIETDKTELQLWLFASAEYLKGGGTFEIELSQKAIPYLFDLKKNFTSMQLKSLLTCTSKYAKRLYMLGCQWRGRGSVPQMPIDELKIMLGLKDPKGKKPEKYKRFSQFKAQVLDIARAQINENTDITIDYNLTKRGRSYYWIDILINYKASKQLEIEFDKPIQEQKMFKTLVELYGIPVQYAMPMVKQGKPQFMEFYNKIIEKVNTGQAKKSDFVPYMIACYQNLGVIPKSSRKKS